MELFLQGLVSLVSVLIGLYLKSFFTEKGKNLATKQDIEAITQKVEGVKADLQVLSQQRISFAAERAKSLIIYCEKYFKWVNYLIQTPMYSVEPNYGDKNSARELEVYNELVAAEAHLTIFVFSDPDFVAVKDKAKLGVFEVRDMFLEGLREIETASNEDVKDIKELYHRVINSRFEAYRKLIPSIREFINAVHLKLDIK